MVIALALGLVFGLAGMSSAAVTTGGWLSYETSFTIWDDDSSMYDSYVAQTWGSPQANHLTVSYLSDDKKFGAILQVGIQTLGGGDGLWTKLANFYYDWGGGRILFGQDYDTMEHNWPTYLTGGWSAIGIGKSYMDRNGMVKLTLGDKYKFNFALVRPLRGDVWGGTGTVYHQLPAISMAAILNLGNVTLTPWLRYENTLWEDGNNTDNYYTLDYGLWLHGQFGLVGFTLAVSNGVNTAQMRPTGSGNPSIVNGEVDDNVYQLNYWGELRIGGLYMGYGMTQSSRGDWTEDPYTQGVWAGYTIPYGQITFMPEILWEDYGESSMGTDNGSIFTFGLVSSLAF
jgi:hypothetical protein